MNTLFSHLTPQHWSLIAVLAATLAARFIAGRILQRVASITAKTSNIWDDALLDAARKPLPILIWLSGLFLALQLHYSFSARELPLLIAHSRTITLTLCGAWFLFGLIHHAAENIVATHIANREEVDFTTVHGISKLSRIAVVVLAVLLIMQSMGFSISGVLAFGGIGGIAIGFAAKDLLANFFGGLMLHLDRPFKLGESIRSPDKEIEGKVEHIGWRQTALRARNMDMIYIPNSLFNSIVLVNLSRRSHRRLEEYISLRYEDMERVTPICAEARAMLLARTDIDTTQDVIVSLNRYGESSIDIFLLAFTRTTDLAEFNATKHSVLLEIAGIVARHGADFAFPTRVLHVRHNDEPPLKIQ